MVITRRGFGRESGFTSVELTVVFLVITLLIIILSPNMTALFSDTRLESAMRDAIAIGAAVEILRIEGKLDPKNTDLNKQVYDLTGQRYEGHIVLTADSGFIYSRTIGGVTYSVYYDSLTGSVSEAK